MILAKIVAVTLDIIMFSIVAAFLMIKEDEPDTNPMATAFFILMEICFAVNAVVIFKL